MAQFASRARKYSSSAHAHAGVPHASTLDVIAAVVATVVAVVVAFAAGYCGPPRTVEFCLRRVSQVPSGGVVVPVGESSGSDAWAALAGQGRQSQFWPPAAISKRIWPFSVKAMNEARWQTGEYQQQRQQQ